jgi:hypothetical protein
LYLQACLKQAYGLLEDLENETIATGKLEALIANVQREENRAGMAKNTRGTSRLIS